MSLKLAKKIVVWGKIVVFAGLVIYIGYVLRQQRFDWTVVQRQLQTVAYPERWAMALFLLTPVNWGFEALKWQILLRRVENVTFWAAYKGVLAGVALGFALPAQLGDTAGRVLSLRMNRAGAVGASLVSGGMQFYVALVFGAVAWGHHLMVAPDRATSGGQLLLVILSLLSGLGVVFGLVRRPVIGWLEKRPVAGRFAKYWTVAGQYDNREIVLALGAAATRYLVFSIQFYMALRLLGINLPVPISASGIGLVFLAKTITPAFNLLSDLGVREAASLWVFAPFGIPAPVLLTATLTLWLANVLTPVLVGLIWVWKLKLTAE
ncbi:lysylphosphatidylglycerol synthase domain-containing protein [Spirosoma agri]|uniref:lysylphosphatidylglycerol synthase domain-containing protein n=1 Tax=Spirosoma agri TaxID=1987381 RepID=UPI001FE36085|nr:lysylphosphatidylglycerol synthase domain-containing protein [Spirosoma agri]